jgi:hypothetical protein
VKYVFLSVLIIGLATLSALSFEAEDLNFFLNDNLWVMEGLYYFANYDTTAVSQLIYFPVLCDSVCSPAILEKIEIHEGTNCQITMLQQMDNGFSYLLFLPAKALCTVQIIYSQHLKGNYVKYILTTANKWGRPLPYAKYTLVKGKEVQITSLPFPVQEQEADKYVWEFYDFTPKKDWEVYFVPHRGKSEE